MAASSPLKDWLDQKRRTPSPFRFKVFDFEEKTGFNVETTVSHLASCYLNNSIDPSFVATLSSHIGWNEIGQYINNVAIPHNKSLKSGKFGEVLSTSLLEEFFTYQVPLRKLHFAIIGDHSLPSNDIVGIKLSEGKISEVCFVESKFHMYDDKIAVKDGYEQLIKYYNKKGIPIIIGFIMQMLHKERNPLFNEFLEYCSKRDGVKDVFRITAIYDADIWDEESLDNLKEVFGESTVDLSVDVVKIKTLKELLTKTYSRLGCVLIE